MKGSLSWHIYEPPGPHECAIVHRLENSASMRGSAVNCFTYDLLEKSCLVYAQPTEDSHLGCSEWGLGRSLCVCNGTKCQRGDLSLQPVSVGVITHHNTCYDGSGGLTRLTMRQTPTGAYGADSGANVLSQASVIQSNLNVFKRGKKQRWKQKPGKEKSTQLNPGLFPEVTFPVESSECWSFHFNLFQLLYEEAVLMKRKEDWLDL